MVTQQCPELNSMGQLWRSVKNDMSANRQYSTIEQHASSAENYILSLSNRQA
jgi:hypothetical protein